MRIRLSTRLFVSHAVVGVIGALVAFLVVRFLLPSVFDQRMGAMGGYGRGLGRGAQSSSTSTTSTTTATTQAQVHEALLSALNVAVAVGLVASALAAGALAVLITRRLLRPLTAVQEATKRIASGDYTAHVPLASEPELAELATDVNSLATALADTEARRTRLLGDVAHEMRTPLTALDGYVEGLIDGVFTSSPEVLASLGEELRRLHRLSDDLSGLSRAQEGRFDLRPVDTDLADLARRAGQRLVPQFEDAGVALQIDAPTPLPARVDPDRITQVLTNLLGNALLATSSGGTVRLTAVPVAPGAGRASGVELAVADTGVGLTPEEVERVFERFYRAPGQLRRSAGSGVGLTIARGIALAHGGELTASSPGKGQGARFAIWLPLSS